MSPKVTKRKRCLLNARVQGRGGAPRARSGKTVAQVARELGLTATCLRAGVNRAEADEEDTGQGALTTDECRADPAASRAAHGRTGA